MSRLDELITEFCPNGVEYRELKDILTIKNGKDYKSLTEGKYPVYGSGGIMTYVSDYLYNKPSVLIPRKGSIDKLYYVEEPFWNVDTIFYTEIDTKQVIPRYVYFCLQKEHLEQYNTAGGVPSLTQRVLNKVKLPVPPLEVQREIVRVLDSFTLLTAELTAELTARKKQYEFYRNKLLTFCNNVKIVPLADIADIGTGSSNTNEGIEEGKYPFYVRSQEPLRKNEYEYDETAIITAGDGVGVGKVFHYVEGKYALHQRAYRIHINTPDVLPRYYFHYMRSAFLPYIQKTMFQGSVASIRRPMLNQFPVPIPALDVQKRIVNVLDNFESICTDLNIGLPAEIETRQKQYEYYRDLLLTFAETGNMLMTDRQTDRQS
ncbi:restriction endonuclease subunit S [Mediterraneibacter massiliensis]|uniref:restriction endonuclease subunit S n=1 Tax=Mediterraneibacter massiliensis TaxID=1720300 RepID=UPI0022E97006|nr:restriction endonuclease subunit S [Mediterraneibacter massiliensis]